MSRFGPTDPFYRELDRLEAKERIRRLVDSLDRICTACMASTSQETWNLLHAVRFMWWHVADYERRVRLALDCPLGLKSFSDVLLDYSKLRGRPGCRYPNES